jgi:hypothetical protein
MYLNGAEGVFVPADYRIGGSVAARFFWPLEQIDRLVRSGAWDQGFRQETPPSSGDFRADGVTVWE